MVIIKVKKVFVSYKKYFIDDLAPGGVFPNANVGNSGAVYTLGTNLPSVDPNNFYGTVHHGPSSTYVGEYPPGPGGY